MVQSGEALTGSVVLGSGCQGVGPVNGTLTGSNLSLTISEFGQDISLVGTLPPGSPGPIGTTFISGSFSTPAGGCTAFPNAGTWSAIQVAPISGSFHGTLTSSLGNGTMNVAGALTQGANMASSNATITGNMNLVGSPHFCSYLSTSTVTGQVSGTSVLLTLYDGMTGLQIAQIPASVTPDGTSISGKYTFPLTSPSCPGDQGALQITFP